MKRLLVIVMLFSGIVAAKGFAQREAPAAVQNDPCHIYYKIQRNAGIWRNMQKDAHYTELLAAFQKVAKTEGFQKALKSPAQQALHTYREQYMEIERAKLFKEHRGLEAQYAKCKKNSKELIALNKEFNKKHPEKTVKQWMQDRSAHNKFLAEHGYTLYPGFGYIKK